MPTPSDHIRGPAPRHTRAARPDRRARHRPRNALRAGKPSHSAGAPAALRAALTGYGRLADHYDFDIGSVRPDHAVDCGDVPGDPADPPGNRAAITAAVRALLDAGAIPVVLGGDDSVPIPMFRAFEGRGPLTVVQIDAHLDWRDEVRGEKYGWSSPMRRASEMPWIRHMVQIGLRGTGSARAEEVADARAWGSRLVTAADVHRHGVAPVLDMVSADAHCLVTLDCDGIDPSVLPAVAARAPGGLLYWQVLELFAGLAAKCRIVGFDLVEFMPCAGYHGHFRAHRGPARVQCDRGDRDVAEARVARTPAGAPAASCPCTRCARRPAAGAAG